MVANDRERWARENWDKGLAYDAWLGTMTRNRDRVEANEARTKVDAATRDALRKIKPVRVAVLAADWCGDVIANLPVLAKLAKEVGTLDVRVFERDGEGSPIDLYLNQGQHKSIPVFAFFDQDFREIGVFIERPDSVTEKRAQRRKEIYASRPEFGSPDAPADQLPEDVRAALQAELAKMREEMADWSNAEVIREIRAIAERKATWGGARQRQAA